MTFHLISLVLSGILSFADYVTENVFHKKFRHNKKLLSFSSGVAISYIILSLFPEIASYAIIDGRSIFLYALIGFVGLNLIEQYIFKEVGKLKSFSVYHKGIHIAYFFAYNFFIGMVLVSFASSGLSQTLLFFVPFLLYLIVEMLPQEFAFRSATLKVFYSMAPLLGTLFGIINVDFVNSIFGELIAFITGTMFYIVIRESLPSEEAERPLYFLVGVMFYTAVIFMSWKFV